MISELEKKVASFTESLKNRLISIENQLIRARNGNLNPLLRNVVKWSDTL